MWQWRPGLSFATRLRPDARFKLDPVYLSTDPQCRYLSTVVHLLAKLQGVGSVSLKMLVIAAIEWVYIEFSPSK